MLETFRVWPKMLFGISIVHNNIGVKISNLITALVNVHLASFPGHVVKFERLGTRLTSTLFKYTTQRNHYHPIGNKITC